MDEMDGHYPLDTVGSFDLIPTGDGAFQLVNHDGGSVILSALDLEKMLRSYFQENSNG